MAPASPRVAVVDYGAGNLRSVAKACERSGMRAGVCADPQELRLADAVVLPGVGAFADAMTSLRAKGMDEAVLEAIGAGRPYLGLCLGLQVLFDESTEHGTTAGLGVLPGRVTRFPEETAGARLRVPHIGWNGVRWAAEHPMLKGLPGEDVYYFVHSFRAEPEDARHTVGLTEYGGPFAAAVARENVVAVQFHPEKSQNAGRRLLDAFAAWIQT